MPRLSLFVTPSGVSPAPGRSSTTSKSPPRAGRPRLKLRAAPSKKPKKAKAKIREPGPPVRKAKIPFQRPRDVIPMIQTPHDLMLSSCQFLILKTLNDSRATGLTDDELALILPQMSLSTTRGRRRELADLGLVKHQGTSRPTARGRKGSVWFITPEGKDYLSHYRGQSPPRSPEPKPTNGKKTKS